jgi:hydrogenase maturation protein HypF
LNLEHSGHIAIEIRITGLVQGVGFRPFVYRIATRFSVNGWVCNASDGVYIRAEADERKLKAFVQALSENAPPAAYISNVSTTGKQPEGISGFSILSSRDQSDDITMVSPDIAVCNECIGDMLHQAHRFNYPFINCTNCGPRFTIIRDLPYDRAKTTMDVFNLCPECSLEYEDVTDRRFHAQPVACNSCGPKYSLIQGDKLHTSPEQVLEMVASMVESGSIIAVKGLGGFFLMCDAGNEGAVKRLRQSKMREGKPFAVMFRDIQTARSYAKVGTGEQKLLESWQRPIVILNEVKPLAPSVSNGFPTIGAMLPYMPFHYLLFRKINLDALVLTSGNISDEPILIENKLAIEILGKISDAVLIYNRDIHNRTDDSVCLLVNNKVRMLRRSRGYVPTPVLLDMNVDRILATGAELVSCFAIGRGGQAIMSQHIGDLKNLETYSFYTESIERFKRLFRVNPSLVAYDLHPDYLSSRYGLDLGILTTGVQHHHAHIASCMSEHYLKDPVIGVAMDGTGYGSDGKIWGSEFMICDLLDYKRMAHFSDMSLPGGDSVTREPWRTALGMLWQVYGEKCLDLNLPFLESIDLRKKKLLLEALVHSVNCPLSSGAGRLFDAVAAITDICPVSFFHAEAPMRLEAAIDHAADGLYTWELMAGGEISFLLMISEMVSDIHRGVSAGIIAGRFHHTIIDVILKQCIRISVLTGIREIVLSGGSFQNRFILEQCENKLRHHGFSVYSNERVPSNDGGIALGQLAIAAARRESGLI